ncbi:nitrogen regulation protein NR(II) [Thermodesulfobacteriota bacterium]
MLSTIEQRESEENAGTGGDGADPGGTETEAASLRRRLIWLIGFRVGIVTCLLGVAILVQAGRGVATTFHSPIGRFYLFIGLTYLLTFPYVVALYRFSNLRLFAFIQLMMDVLLVSLLVFITGGVGSVFPVLYIPIIIGACIFVPGRRSVLVTSACAAAYTAMVTMEWVGWIVPYYSSLSRTPNRDPGYIFFTLFSNLFALALAAFLCRRLSVMVEDVSREMQDKDLALEGLRALNRDIVESINAGLITIDLEQRIISFNRAAAIITGFTMEEVLGKPIGTIFPEMDPYISDSSDASRVKKTLSRWDAMFTNKEGKDLRLGFSASRLQDTGGNDLGQVIIFQDLTRYKELEDELRRADRMAVVGRMAAGIAHEIRNPLASISGSVEILHDGLDVSGKEERLMGIVARETDRLNELITKFLLFAKPDAGEREPIDLVEIIDETVILLNNHPALGNGVSIEKNCPRGNLVLANVGQLKQVFWNLLLNSVEAVGSSGIVSIDLHRIEGGDAAIADRKDNPTKFGIDCIEIDVHDTGSGIETEVIDKIFDPFFTTKDHGSGLGLAVAYRIVENHQGHIVVNSRPDEGTTFRIFLPSVGEPRRTL